MFFCKVVGEYFNVLILSVLNKLISMYKLVGMIGCWFLVIFGKLSLLIWLVLMNCFISDFNVFSVIGMLCLFFF